MSPVTKRNADSRRKTRPGASVSAPPDSADARTWLRTTSSSGRKPPQSTYVSPPSAPAHQETPTTNVNVRSGNAMRDSKTKSSQARGSVIVRTHPIIPGCVGRYAGVGSGTPHIRSRARDT